METSDWQAILDLIEGFEKELAEFQKEHARALEEEDIKRGITRNYTIKPLGDVFDDLTGAVQDARSNMPKITECEDYEFGQSLEDFHNEHRTY